MGKSPLSLSWHWNVLLAFVTCCYWSTLLGDPRVIQPEESLDQNWRIADFSKDASIKGRNVFNIAFEKGATPKTLARVWVATSDGLREFDGYHWTRHGITNGIPSDFVRCVHVTRSGVVWVGTDHGAGIYDGRTFRVPPGMTNLAGPSVRRIAEDSDGTLWFCSDPWPNATQRGGLTSYKDGVIHAYRTSEGLPSEYVVNYFQDLEKRQWVVTKYGLARFDGIKWLPSLAPSANIDSFSSGTLAEPSEGALAFSNGFDLFTLVDNRWVPQPFPLPHRHGICGTQDGHLFACLTLPEGKRCVAVRNSNGWQRVSASFELTNSYCEDLQEAPDGNIWIVAYETLICWQRNSQWKMFRGLPPPALVDASNHVWFSSPREGITPPSTTIRYTGSQWEQIEESNDGLVLDSGRTVWGWNSNRVSHWRGTVESRYTAQQLGLQRIEVVRPSLDGNIWILGRTPEGRRSALKHAKETWSTHPTDLGDANELLPSLIHPAARGIWFIHQKSNRENIHAVHVTEFEREEVPILAAILSEFRSGLYPDSDERGLWLYGDAGLHHWSKSEKHWETITNLPGRSVIGMVERPGEFWFACGGATGGQTALARLAKGTWTQYPSAVMFDISKAADETLLIAGRNQFTVVPNSALFDGMDILLPSPIQLAKCLKDRSGRYWVGNSQQTFCFQTDGIPPVTEFETSNTRLMEGESVKITVSAREKFQPSQRNLPQQFSWRLNGGDWSAFSSQATWTSTPGVLKPGPFLLEARARDSGFDPEPKPAALSFIVYPIPLQNRPWFLWVVLAVIALPVALAITAFKMRADLVKYSITLEQKVADRTAALQADLEQRRRAEEALRESEQRFSKAFHANPAIITISTLPDGKFLDVNDAFHNVLGYARGEVLGRTGTELGIWGSMQTQEVLFHSIQQNQLIRGFECTLRAKDGTPHTVLISGERIELGEIPCALLIQHDITNARRLEHHLRQSQKMDALGTLSGGIAHDFNNILGAILGNLQLAKYELDPKHPAYSCLVEGEKASNRAKHLVQQILMFSRKQPQTLTPTSIGPVVEEIVGLLRSTLPASVQLIQSVDPTTPEVLADPTQIHQVLMNLCTNAWHALENNRGTIRIQVSPIVVDQLDYTRFPVLPIGSYAQVEVTDTGRGMDQKTLERIFEPFFSTKEPGKGTGLGLAVVHGIVQSHNGILRVQSQPNHGTTFRLYLPAIPASAPTPVFPETPSRPGAGQNILFLDDEASLVEIGKRMLSRLGYKPHGFNQPEAALEILKKSLASYDLIITDLSMPGMTGLEFAAKVRAWNPSIPILIISGFYSEANLAEARSMGVKAIASKPISSSQLAALIEEQLGNHPPA